MNKLTTIDDVINAMGADAPKRVYNPADNKPLAVADAIALARSQETIADKPLNVLDAAMHGLAFDVQLKSGKTWKINEGKAPAKLAGIDRNFSAGDDSLNEVLSGVMQAVLANEQTFDVDTIWSYAKVSTSLEYSTVYNWAAKHLETLSKERFIKVANPLSTPKLYAK